MMLSFTGMYTMYIIDIGFTRTQIGIAATIYIFATLIGKNFIGYLADRFKCIKKILLLSISSGIPVAILLIFSKQVWYVCLLIFIWGFFIGGTIPLSEIWFIRILKEKNTLQNFGTIRGVGSLGYGLAGVVIGFLLQKLGWDIFPLCILVTVFITIATIVVMKDIDPPLLLKVQKSHRKEVKYIDAIKEIFRIRPLRKIVLIVFLYLFVIHGIYSYLGVLISDFGGGPLSLGTTYLFDASPEIITFFLTARLMRRYGSKKLIAAAFVLQILRLTLILVFNSPSAIMFLGILSGFVYGLIASSYKTYIYELAPEKYKASCSGLSESIIGLSGVLSVPVFGFVILKYGGITAITMGLVINIIVLMWLILGDKQRPGSNTARNISRQNSD